MPKLDGTHILQRLTERISQLKAGEEIAAKEIRSLLTTKQQQELDDLWEEQQALRKGKKARTEEEGKALGWKTKREVRIEVFTRALATAWEGIDSEFERLQAQATIRQAKIYFDEYKKAIAEGKEISVAKNRANNELTRAGLRRMDGKQVNRFMTARDKEVFEMEESLRESLKNEMTAQELEQQSLLKQQDGAIKRAGKARK
jgi:hypothetical protein